MKRYENIQVPLPENLKPEFLDLFKKRQVYKCRIPRIREIKNAFVTHEGLVLKNGVIAKRSAFNLWGKSDKTFFFEFWKLAFEQFLVSTYGKSLKRDNLKEDEYLLVYTKWFGYFFWVTDSLPRLIRTISIHANLKLIFPKGWEKVPYVNDTLILFPQLRKEVIPSGVHMKIKKLILPETRDWSNAIDPKEIENVRAFLFQHLNEKNIQTDLGNKIYISRKKALRRKPVNNDEVENCIEKLGFKSVCFEEYSFLDQISIVRNAKFLIGLHGAGLANLQFLSGGAAVLELTPKVHDPKNFRIPFWRLANAIKAKYFVQFCDIEKKANEDEYDSNLYVNIKELEENIVSMLKYDNKKG